MNRYLSRARASLAGAPCRASRPAISEILLDCTPSVHVIGKNETTRGNDRQLHTSSARPGACPGSHSPAGVRAMGRSRHQQGGVWEGRTSSSHCLGATWRPSFSASRRHRQNVTRRATGASDIFLSSFLFLSPLCYASSSPPPFRFLPWCIAALLCRELRGNQPTNHGLA